ncbi:methyl-accepting chemotaxis protein [Moritella marina ATCC 15381]|uniref:Methyl-accepting chemotaxis protein n=1 Tax=Moritella marina ATCC 15381 TaxID=1202962 RepID=A0A5J6WJ35_MORMI|nr:PAS domain-containing methyl-accepting chemotaxis protein [Moritella marina]QFI37278.1 methyl-accepting chemotaxis protein [Moritella marina ATCC 15381]
MAISTTRVTAKQYSSEIDYSASIDLISTTDPQSNITHTNKNFLDVAGYTANEMYNQPHNLVRHQDMPKQAFTQLWQYLGAGKSWMGLVKNNCKNGDYYWVSAFVTPIKNNKGKVIEYQSVRSKPDSDSVTRAAETYANMKAGKTTLRSALRLKQSTIMLTLAALSLLFLDAYLLTSNAVLLSIGIIAASLNSLTVIWTNNRLRDLNKLANKAYDNALMEYIYTGNKDDLSTVELALKMRQAELRAIVGRVSETSAEILQSAEDELVQGQKIQTNITQQNDATEQVSVAMEQMSLSVRDISKSAVEASSLNFEAQEMSIAGLQSVETTIDSVHSLHQELDNSKQVINLLSEDCLQIETVLDVIGAIADQTNLLALNAAIEAARAGEQGRGFAVVADEVRSLAKKTQESTGEIQQMIEKLQASAGKAVNSVERGAELSKQCNDLAAETGEHLSKINNKLKLVTDSSHQIASAVEEQACVSDEISRNIENISQLSTATSKTSEKSVENTHLLVSKLDTMQRLIVQFKTNE